jgi:hypothetical protein
VTEATPERALLLNDGAMPPATPRRSLGRGLLLVALIFLATRILVWAAAYTGAAVFFCIRHQWEPPLAQHMRPYRETPPDPDSPEYRSAHNLMANLAPLCQFDGLNYQSIIDRGYQYAPPPAEAKPYEYQQNIAFFPLYPLICWPLAQVLGTRAAMILVAHLAALAAGGCLYAWLRRRLDEGGALFAVAVVFCWPAACYFSFAYAESLTLLLLVLALWAMDRRAFGWAAVACALATATRPTAAGIVLVLMLAYWLSSARPRRQRAACLVGLTVLAAGGALIYAGYLTGRFGSPTVYWDNFEAGWVPRKLRADWVSFLTMAPIWSQLGKMAGVVVFWPLGLIELANPLRWNVPLSLLLVVVSFVGMRGVPRSFRPLLLLAPIIFVHAYLASGGAGFGIEPIGRYVALGVPTLIVLAAWFRRRAGAGLSCALLVALVLMQVAWAWRFGLREWSG